MLQRDTAWLRNPLAYPITTRLRDAVANSIAACHPHALAHSFAAWLWNALAYPNTSRFNT